MPEQIPQLDEDGFPAFEPVRFYDAPATILTQIFDGEGSLSRAARTFFDQESLSPAERDSYAQRLKAAYGGNPATNTAIDLATNPLVWFLALTSPIGRKQFAATGGKLLSGLSEMRKGTAASKFAVNIAQMLRVPGLTGLISSTETQAPSMLLQAITSNLKKLREEEARFISAPRGALMRKLGVSDLDPSRGGNTVLQELNRLLHYWESGYAEPGTVLNRRFVSTVVGKVHTVGKDGALGAAEPMILPRAAMEQLRRDPNIDLIATNLNLGKGQQFKLGDVMYQMADDGVFVNNERTLQQARAFFPKAAKGEAWGKYKDLVKYIGLEDDMAQTMHIVGLDKDAILGWARSNNIEKEFLDYVTASSRMRDNFKKRLFGKMNPDGSVPERFELDANKVIRYYTRHQRSKGSAESIAERVAMQEILGADFFTAIDNALPAWVKSSVRTGSHRVKLSDVEDVLNRMLMPQLESPYLPRNTSKVIYVDKMGRTVNQGPTAIDALARRRDPGMSLDEIQSIVLPREKTELFYDPDDLLALGDIARRHGKGGPEVMVFEPGGKIDSEAVPLASLINKTRAAVQNRISIQESISLLSMDHELAMRKYMRDAQATIALHGTDMPEHLKPVLQQAIRTPSPKFRGAYNPTEIKYDEEKIRSQLEFLGIRREDLQYLDPAAAVLQEDVVANPALVRWREKIASLRSQARVTTGKAQEKLIKEASRLEKKLEKVGLDLKLRDVALLNPELDRRVSMAEALRVVLSRESLEVQEQFAKHLLPHMFGGAKPAQLFGLRANQEIRLMAGRFANSGMGKWMERNGGDIGRNFITAARDYSTKTGYELDAAYRSSGLTGYLYATHLGFNAASAMWNAMQPLQWAATWMGGREVLGAYGSALKQLGAYTKERVSKYGFAPMDPLARRELWLKHVPTAGRGTGGRDLLGLSDDVISTLDAALISAPVGEKPSMLKYLTVDMPLKLFQKAEELNRIVVAEAGLKWYNRMNRESGLRMTADEVFDQVSIMQSLVNFNPNPSTQLRIFQEGGLLSNPMMRMFLQYPMRSVSNILVSQQLGGGVREVGFGPLKFEAPAAIADTARLLGTGAVIYEIGKNMANLDLSSGLGAAALTQLPGQITVAGALPMPPVVDIPLKLVNSLVEQDREAFRQVAFRLVPGGLAIQKALGSLPAVPGGGNFGIIQSQYADWGNRNEQGMVPVYNSDGMLQGFESPFALVMRGIGADFKRHQSPQEATKFLLANRAQMVDLRRKYKDAVLGNNMSAAQAIEAEYRKRYGVPMTVKPGEWDRAIEMRETTVSERMLDTMPEDVRGAYQQSLQSAPFATAMGLPVGGLAQGETARQRASIRGFNVDVVNPAEGQ